MLPQSLGMLDELTLAENVGLPLRLARVPRAADPHEVMDSLGVGHLGDRYPREVSLGEQQRAALARATVVRPQVLLADEPTMHQNRGWAESVMATLADLAAGGTACVLATHDAVALAGARPGAAGARGPSAAPLTGRVDLRESPARGRPDDHGYGGSGSEPVDPELLVGMGRVGVAHRGGGPRR